MPKLFSVASGAARALWLAELSKALDEAHDLTCRLGDGIGDLELMDLYIRIEAARHEIRALRLGDFRSEEDGSGRGGRFRPERINSSPWPLSPRVP